MNRRDALKNGLLLLGGVFVISGCGEDQTVHYNNFKLKATEVVFLKVLAETIIPQTDTLGSEKLGLHEFVLKMLDDCHSPTEQAQFCDGLSRFRKWAQERLEKAFENTSLKERTHVLQSMGEVDIENVDLFYKITKKRVIQGYLKSKYVMTDLVPYQLVPDRYVGDVALSS
ncbi:gluconate 2-dehydrogenase subunit 3 family protein [Sphingobacterium faecale]|uniref:Gluconate 2-dehydrogenase subunit 3 family protein n=1 Tax=Sphingobacterium faecale TaxID=2803775 RepID=A0ABS1RAD1_9SPHI|nr:gluconate 2-dehydrogenase subunit 3 family protein [Sphingobacterium faecale]MBL1411189.1 gluconate 2-dehydrogenase subunit 3 family protein [Sphingobacterium faecale]